MGREEGGNRGLFKWITPFRAFFYPSLICGVNSSIFKDLWPQGDWVTPLYPYLIFAEITHPLDRCIWSPAQAAFIVLVPNWQFATWQDLWSPRATLSVAVDILVTTVHFGSSSTHFLCATLPSLVFIRACAFLSRSLPVLFTPRWWKCNYPRHKNRNTQLPRMHSLSGKILTIHLNKYIYLSKYINNIIIDGRRLLQRPEHRAARAGWPLAEKVGLFKINIRPNNWNRVETFANVVERHLPSHNCSIEPWRF